MRRQTFIALLEQLMLLLCMVLLVAVTVSFLISEHQLLKYLELVAKLIGTLSLVAFVLCKFLKNIRQFVHVDKKLRDVQDLLQKQQKKCGELEETLECALQAPDALQQMLTLTQQYADEREKLLVLQIDRLVYQTGYETNLHTLGGHLASHWLGNKHDEKQNAACSISC